MRTRIRATTTVTVEHKSDKGRERDKGLKDSGTGPGPVALVFHQGSGPFVEEADTSKDSLERPSPKGTATQTSPRRHRPKGEEAGRRKPSRKSEPTHSSTTAKKVDRAGPSRPAKPSLKPTEQVTEAVSFLDVRTSTLTLSSAAEEAPTSPSRVAHRRAIRFRSAEDLLASLVRSSVLPPHPCG